MSKIQDRAGKAISVIGAGVIGLSTALVLAQSGMRVRVFSGGTARAPTSPVAGASWSLHLARHADALRWGTIGYQTFSGLAGDAQTGVRMVSGVEAYDQGFSVPRWAESVPDFRPLSAAEVPCGYAGAWRYTVPLIDMPVYMRWLTRALAEHGVTVEIRPPIARFSDLDGTIVNCTGLGAEELTGETMNPDRGQLVLVENPGVGEFFQDNVSHGELTYILPHRDYVVLGGTSAPGERSLEWDEDEAAAITARCVAIEPRLAGARVVGRRVGLRPGRSAIRVERDPDDPRVIHNYGHGGSGVTLSWGCAQDVLRLLTGPVVAGPPRNVDR